MKEDDNMFTRIIEISYVEQNAAAVAVCFLKHCPLILGLLRVFWISFGTWISHQETSEMGSRVSRDGILHLRDCENSHCSLARTSITAEKV